MITRWKQAIRDTESGDIITCSSDDSESQQDMELYLT